MHTLTYIALCAVVSLTYAKKVVELSGSVVERVRPFEDECIKESGSIPDSLYHMLKNSLPNDAANKKFISCFGSKGGYLDGTGHIAVDKFVDLTKEVTEGKDEFVKALNECNKITDDDLTELASKLAACFHEKSPYALSVSKRQ